MTFLRWGKMLTILISIEPWMACNGQCTDRLVLKMAEMQDIILNFNSTVTELRNALQGELIKLD